jgi:nicotinate-nucleotide--dimethylbenzimidazole phosphoribosyltransferase
VIRFSAALVAVAIGVLIGGIATSRLLLVYIAIAVSAVALAALAIGVVLKREELFGEAQGLVPAGAGTTPVMPARAGESRPVVPSYVPPPPVPGTAVGYGVPFGGAAPAAPPTVAADLSVAPLAAARPGRSADPAPPWATPARDSWPPSAPDWMPAGQDQRAVSGIGGAGVRSPSAWQETSPGKTASGRPDSWGVPEADPPAAAAAPRSWAAPSTAAVTADTVTADAVSSDAAAVKPGSGPAAAPPSWFDRRDSPADGDAPATTPTSASGSGGGWSWSGGSASEPGAPGASQEEPEAPAAPADSAASGDEDDDWPTRYSWLDDETDESAGAGQAEDEAPVDEAPAAATGLASDAKVPAGTDAAPDAGPARPEPPAAATMPAATIPGPPPAAATRDTATAAAGTPDAATQDAPASEPEDTARQDTARQDTARQDTARQDTARQDTARESDADPADPEDSAVPIPATEADPSARPASETAADDDADQESEAGPADEPPAGDASTAESETTLVSVVRGVPRYHEAECVLIRFMPAGDVQKVTIPQARNDGCTPCTACQPEG